MILYDWAIRHGVPMAAIKELEMLLGVTQRPGEVSGELSEAAVQNNVRLEASRKGVYLWRNNIGAGHLKDGSFIRWGLANESSEVNRVIKSADLIGIRPVTITSQMVGHTFGQFVSREVKPDGWQYTATEREEAQLTWAMLILSLGGDACFVTKEGTI
jgi:hypothetical protein